VNNTPLKTVSITFFMCALKEKKQFLQNSKYLVSKSKSSTKVHDNKNSARNQPMCHHLQYLHEELAKTFASYIRFQLNFIAEKKKQ